MEHSCQKCGALVEDGRPFCPQCRAPQINVQIAIGDDPVAPGLNSAREFSPEFSQILHSDRTGKVASIIDSRLAVRAALQAGVLGVFIAMLPILGILLTGTLAVFLYRRKNGFDLPAALGARVGAAAGVVVFAINAMLVIPIIVFHAQQECVDRIVEVAQKYGINTATPQFQANIHELFTVSGLAAFFISTVVLASIGGAIGSLLLRSRNTRT